MIWQRHKKEPSTILRRWKVRLTKGRHTKEAKDLIKPAKAISETEDIKAARAAFLDLSRQMASLVEHVGTTKDTPLYTAFCPMAFNNKGGQWVQSEKTVSNPYYGSMMLRCGSIQKKDRWYDESD